MVTMAVMVLMMISYESVSVSDGDGDIHFCEHWGRRRRIECSVERWKEGCVYSAKACLQAGEAQAARKRSTSSIPLAFPCSDWPINDWIQIPYYPIQWRRACCKMSTSGSYKTENNHCLYLTFSLLGYGLCPLTYFCTLVGYSSSSSSSFSFSFSFLTQLLFLSSFFIQLQPKLILFFPFLSVNQRLPCPHSTFLHSCTQLIHPSPLPTPP